MDAIVANSQHAMLISMEINRQLREQFAPEIARKIPVKVHAGCISGVDGRFQFNCKIERDPPPETPNEKPRLLYDDWCYLDDLSTPDTIGAVTLVVLRWMEAIQHHLNEVERGRA